jgi:hypothetical protein
MKSKEFIEQLQDLDPDGEMNIFFHFSKGVEYFNYVAEDVITYDSNTPGVKEIIVLLNNRYEEGGANETDNQ